MRVGSIVIRCYEFDRMLAFWQAHSITSPERQQRVDGWCYRTRSAEDRTFPWTSILKGAKAKGADFTWTSTRAIRKMKLDAYYRWEPFGIHGDTDPGTTLLC